MTYPYDVTQQEFRLKFVAKLYARTLDSNGTFRYTWREQVQDARGLYVDSAPGRWGTSTDGRWAVELNNVQVDVTSKPLVFLHYVEDAYGGAAWRFQWTASSIPLLAYVTADARPVYDQGSGLGLTPKFYWPGYLARWNTTNLRMESTQTTADSIYITTSNYGMVPPFCLQTNPGSVNGIPILVPGGACVPVFPTNGTVAPDGTTPVFTCEGGRTCLGTNLATLSVQPTGQSNTYLQAKAWFFPTDPGTTIGTAMFDQVLVSASNWTSIILSISNGVLANWPATFLMNYSNTYVDSSGRRWPHFHIEMPFWGGAAALFAIQSNGGTQTGIFEGGFLLKTTTP